MRFHKLTVRNFRGITEHVVDFPEQGVLVVEGPNEAGKSSLLEAIDLLFRFKDSSTGRVVADTHPIGRDEAPYVELDAQVGPYRFVYAKRWAKRGVAGARGRGGETTLRITAPRTENLTGIQAHERVGAIVDEHLDTDLWQALRVLQGSELAPVQLGASAMLRSALDAAAGSGADAGGEGDSILEHAEKEYGRYFTPATGKARGEYERATRELALAVKDHQEAEAAVAEVEQSVQRHAALLTRTESLKVALTDALETRDRLAEQRELAAERVDNLRVAEAALVEAKRDEADATAAVERRRVLVDDVTRRGLEVATAAEALEQARRRAASWTAEEESTRVEAQRGSQAAEAARRQLERARSWRHRQALEAELARLATRVQQVDQLSEQIAQARATLATLHVDPAARAAVEQAERALDRAKATQRAASASVTAHAISPKTRLVVDGEEVLLDADPREWVLTETLRITVPEVAEFRMAPAAGAAQRSDEVEQAERALRSLLTDVEVDSVEAAYHVAAQRGELEATVERAEASRSAVLAGDQPNDLRDRLAELQRRTAVENTDDAKADEGFGQRDAPEEKGTGTLECPEESDDGSEQALAGLVEAEREAREQFARLRDRAERARAAAQEATQATTVAEVEVGAGRRELSVRAAELDEARGTASDAGLTEILSKAVAAVEKATLDRDLAAELAAESDRDQQRFEAAERRVDGARTRLEETDRERVGLEAVLEQVGSQGRAERADAAASDLDRATRTERTIARRASAAKLLRETLRRHRDEAQAAYVAPFRDAVERLGRLVYGSGFQVVVGPDLLIEERVLDGSNVPFESLSSGAKEQMSILVRLAVAGLVDPSGGAPVVIDDALGYSDPERLLAITAAFGAVAQDVQVVLLTCTPGRYDGVVDAQTVRLGTP